MRIVIIVCTQNTRNRDATLFRHPARADFHHRLAAQLLERRCPERLFEPVLVIAFNTGIAVREALLTCREIEALNVA